MSYENELAAAKKAVSLAALLCHKAQKALLRSDVQSKSDRTPVTIADYGSQAVVSLVLQKELGPEAFSLVAEEDSSDLPKSGEEILDRVTELVNDILGGDEPFRLSKEEVIRAIDCGKSEGGPHGQHWILDPIDGTKGFLRGGQYAVALALVDEGEVVLGVLGCPNLPLEPIRQNHHHCGSLFYAKLGSGTYMHSLDASNPLKKVQVNVSDVENPEEASLFESFEKPHYLCASVVKKLGIKVAPVRMDSQVKYAALSRGDGSIYLRFPYKGYREKIWDHAAGSILVTEAGGIVMDVSGKKLDFSRGRYLEIQTGIIVTSHKLQPCLLRAVTESIHELLFRKLALALLFTYRLPREEVDKGMAMSDLCLRFRQGYRTQMPSLVPRGRP